MKTKHTSKILFRFLAIINYRNWLDASPSLIVYDHRSRAQPKIKKGGEIHFIGFD